MTTEPQRKHPLLTALMILIAICAIPFVLLGLAGAAQERRR